MPNYGPALFVTAWKVAQVRPLCPFLVFHSNHGLLCACCVRAWVADAKRTLGLREAFREQFMLGGQGMRQCACRTGAKQCTTQRCKCRKAGVLCTSCCHVPCVNDMCQEIVVLQAPVEIVTPFCALISCGRRAFAPLVQGSVRMDFSAQASAIC